MSMNRIAAKVSRTTSPKRLLRPGTKDWCHSSNAAAMAVKVIAQVAEYRVAQ